MKLGPRRLPGAVSLLLMVANLWAPPAHAGAFSDGWNLPSGLVGYWRGEGDATDALGRNDGTWIGASAYGPGACGQAFVFDGASRVEMRAAGLPSGNGDRTLAAWVKIDVYMPGVPFFAGYGGFGALTQSFHLAGDEGNMVVFSQWGDGMTGLRLRAGAWYHVVVTNEGAQCRLYLNGAPIGTRSLTIGTPADSRFYLGGVGVEGLDYFRLRGSVDEVAVFSRALSPSEIRSMFASGFGGTAERVVPALTADDRAIVEASQGLSDAADLASRGRYADAVPLLERAVESLEGAVGLRHHRSTFALTELGTALERMGEYERARAPFQRALESAVPGSIGALVLENLHARLSFRLGHYAEAQARLEDPKTRHPVYWAAFIVSGDWRPLLDRGGGI